MRYQIPETLETPRLHLRKFALGDWEDLCVVWRDPDCTRYTLGQPAPDWLTWRLMSGLVGHWELRGYGPYAAVEKSSGRAMGPVGLWYPGDWPEPECQFSLGKAYWGKGYATEAAEAVLRMTEAHLPWTRLISMIAPENTASMALSRRLGGKLEKTIPFRDDKANVMVYTLKPRQPVLPG